VGDLRVTWASVSAITLSYYGGGRRKGEGQGLERFRRPLRGQRQTHFVAASAQCYCIAEAESEDDTGKEMSHQSCLPLTSSLSGKKSEFHELPSSTHFHATDLVFLIGIHLLYESCPVFSVSFFSLILYLSNTF